MKWLGKFLYPNFVLYTYLQTKYSPGCFLYADPDPTGLKTVLYIITSQNILLVPQGLQVLRVPHEVPNS